MSKLDKLDELERLADEAIEEHLWLPLTKPSPIELKQMIQLMRQMRAALYELNAECINSGHGTTIEALEALAAFDKFNGG